jgi:hypothetical protein
MLRGKTKIIPCDHVVFFKEKIHRLCAVICKFCKIYAQFNCEVLRRFQNREEKKKQHTERFSVVLLVVVVTLDFSDESPVNP